MTKILGIAGSPSHPSRSYSVLDYAQPFLQDSGVSYEILSVRNISPEALIYGQFNHPDVIDAIAKVEQASGLIVATPVYKAAYTGVLKAFLDLLPQNALVGKSILPVATGGTIAHFLILDYALQPVLSTLGARNILSGVYLVDSKLQKLEGGEIKFLDEELEQRFKNAVEALAALVYSPHSFVTNVRR